MKLDAVEWGRVLGVLRNVRGWNQKQLAAAMRVRPATVSDYERGEKAKTETASECATAAPAWRTGGCRGVRG